MSFVMKTWKDRRLLRSIGRWWIRKTREKIGEKGNDILFNRVYQCFVHTLYLYAYKHFKSYKHIKRVLSNLMVQLEVIEQCTLKPFNMWVIYHNVVMRGNTKSPF